ncbi:tigger transposable element-derived protein 2-like [Dysidea avara]|uniref:tigger transposable element-derived protein 2-like n=1 Tax=Dysidea avara TaxID=196820 RepID=UPI0033247AB2
MAKRTHKTLTIVDKMKILDKIGTKSYTVLSEEYGVGRSTICDIKRKEAELREYNRNMKEMGMVRPAKVMKCGKDVELEKALFIWFKQKREDGIPISGSILKAKALELHKRLQELRSSGTAVNDGGYRLEQVFNCDETGLYYKLLPTKTLAAHFEKSAAGRKTQKERVTINACSNITGTIKLPLMFIGKARKPRCFKHIDVDSLPVVYKNQSNAWMNCELFSDWFHSHFVPFVQEALKKEGIAPRAMLLLDNCSAHPDEEELVSNDKKVVAKFLPPNVTAFIQPMDQGVLSSIKRRYRRKILEDLVLQDADGKPVLDFLKSINVLRVIGLISSCWNEISSTTLRKSWRKIFPIEESLPLSSSETSLPLASPPANDDEPSDADFCETLQLMVSDAEEMDITEWLQADENDQGYAHLDDQEIVEFVATEHGDDTCNNDDDDNDDEVQVQPCRVSHAEAAVCADKLLIWLQKQDESEEECTRSSKRKEDRACPASLQAVSEDQIRALCTSLESHTDNPPFPIVLRGNECRPLVEREVCLPSSSTCDPTEQDSCIIEEMATETHSTNPEEAVFAYVRVSQEEAEKIQLETKEQSKSSAWFKARQCRITASYFGRVCKKLPSNPGIKLD